MRPRTRKNRKPTPRKKRTPEPWPWARMAMSGLGSIAMGFAVLATTGAPAWVGAVIAAGLWVLIIFVNNQPGPGEWPTA